MDNRTIDEVRKNETKLINEIKVLEIKMQKYKEVICKLRKRLLELSYLNDELIDRELLDILKEVE